MAGCRCAHVFDDVILHTFRDAQTLTISDHLPEDVWLQRTMGRLANYPQFLSDEFVADH